MLKAILGLINFMCACIRKREIFWLYLCLYGLNTVHAKKKPCLFFLTFICAHEVCCLSLQKEIIQRSGIRACCLYFVTSSSYYNEAVQSVLCNL